MVDVGGWSPVPGLTLDRVVVFVIDTTVDGFSRVSPAKNTRHRNIFLGLRSVIWNLKRLRLQVPFFLPFKLDFLSRMSLRTFAFSFRRKVSFDATCVSVDGVSHTRLVWTGHDVRSFNMEDRDLDGELPRSCRLCVSWSPDFLDSSKDSKVKMRSVTHTGTRPRWEAGEPFGTLDPKLESLCLCLEIRGIFV